MLYSVASEVIAGDALYLHQAAAIIPPSRRGRPVSPSCVFRWITTGVKVPGGGRVRLEATRIAGKLVTSRAALQRFLEAQSRQPVAEAAPVRTPTRRARQQQQAAAELSERYGI